MGEMGENCPLRFKFSDHLYRCVNVEMSEMGRVAEGINYQEIQAAEQCPGRFRNGAAVSKIGRGIDTVACCITAAVDQGDWRDCFAEQLKGVADDVRFQQRGITVVLHALEDIGKVAGYNFECSFCAVARDDTLVDKMEAAQIVDAVNVVGMGMGKQHGIDVGVSFPGWPGFLRSVEVSTRIYLPAVSIRMEARVLLSRVSRRCKHGRCSRPSARRSKCRCREWLSSWGVPRGRIRQTK